MEDLEGIYVRIEETPEDNQINEAEIYLISTENDWKIGFIN